MLRSSHRSLRNGVRTTADIGFPDEIPGLTVNQATVDQYVDWQSYDKTWPHGGDDADDELDFDGIGESDKENKWVVAASSQ